MTGLTPEEEGVLAPHWGQLRRVVTLARRLRRLSPSNAADPGEPADVLVKDERLHDRAVKAVNITLTPTGCAWARSGGCTMCGEWAGSTGGQLVPADVHVGQLEVALRRLDGEEPAPSWVRIYQEGNYTNAGETSVAAQEQLLRRASQVPWIKRITIETMASRVTRDGIAALRASVRNGVELEVGLGFEAVDPLVRNLCVNKGESIEDYSRAASILRECGCHALAYVLVKPPFLTESEGIAQAVDTVNAAVSMGFDAVSVEPVSIHDWSLVGALYFAKLYRLPWIWSVVDVMRQVNSGLRRVSRPRPELRIGGYEYYPHPSELAHNYHARRSRDCSADAWERIRRYNETQDVGVFDDFACACVADWIAERELERPSEWESLFGNELPPIAGRLIPILDRVDVDAYVAHLRRTTRADGEADA